MTASSPGPEALLYGLPLAFLAGLIDAVAGGGGTISLPALSFMGLSPVNAVATNKLLAVFGSATSTYQYWRGGHLDRALLGRTVPLALLGSALGAYAVRFVNPDSFRTLVGAVILVVGVLVVINKRFGLESESTSPGLTPRTLVLALPGVLAVGLYDGFLGPGTGTFLMLLFALLGMNLLQSSGNARAVNFATNIGALVFFLLGGHIIWWLGLSMGLANALGARTGARLAMLKGSRFVKIIYAVIVVLVALTLFRR